MYLAFWSKWFLKSLYNMNPLQGYFGVFLQIHIRLDFKQCAKHGCLLLAKIEKNVDFRLMRNFPLPPFQNQILFLASVHLSFLSISLETLKGPHVRTRSF